MRTNMEAPAFREAVKTWKRGATKDRQRFMKVFNSAIDRHSKLLLIRIDLGLMRHQLGDPSPLALSHPPLNGEARDPLPPAFDGSLPLEGPEHRVVVSFEEIDLAREKLLRSLRDRFGRSPLSYVWKLEYGARKGYHYHCVFLLNGAKHRQDISIANLIGELWKKYAPHGLGIFRNCNADRAQYRFPATGVLRYKDTGYWKGLNLIADYLTKPDYYIGLRLPQGRRTFGSSELPKVTRAKRGPKRAIADGQGASRLLKYLPSSPRCDALGR